MIRQLYIYRDETKFAQMQKLMEHLIDLRSQLLSGLLTQQQVYELKLNIANKISFGNRMLDLDLIPREENGEAVTTSNHGAVHIFNSVRIAPFYTVHSNICLSNTIRNIPENMLTIENEDDRGSITQRLNNITFLHLMKKQNVI